MHIVCISTHLISITAYEAGDIIIPFLQMQKGRQREVKQICSKLPSGEAAELRFEPRLFTSPDCALGSSKALQRAWTPEASASGQHFAMEVTQ